MSADQIWTVLTTIGGVALVVFAGGYRLSSAIGAVSTEVKAVATDVRLLTASVESEFKLQTEKFAREADRLDNEDRNLINRMNHLEAELGRTPRVGDQFPVFPSQMRPKSRG